MAIPTYFLFYVESTAASRDFYAPLLDIEPVEDSETFVLFVLPNGHKLGLWARHTVTPAPTAGGGGMEMAITVESPASVDKTHADWASRSIPMAQEPIDLPFGRSFVALDPDGHRLRVFSAAQGM